jgi:hypothetical protein
VTTATFKTPGLARKAWNTRTPDPAVLVDALEVIGSGCTASRKDIDNKTVAWMQGKARAALAQFKGEGG